MITVTLRKRKTNTGNIYLYLDYHPAVFNPRTFKTIRRESLKIKLYANPQNAREKKYNEIMLEKGEAIRCKRQIELVNEQYGFLDKSTRGEDFLDYFYKASLKKSEKWMATYRHFKEFMKGRCTFGALSIGLCDKFKDYLLTVIAEVLECDTVALTKQVISNDKQINAVKVAFDKLAIPA